MIISCPSCATRYDLPASHFAAEGTMIKCASCGHSWLEARAVEIFTTPARQVPATINHAYEPDQDVRRLVEASREAHENFAARRRQRLRRLGGWGALAASVVLVLGLAMAFPELVVAAAPAAVRAYDVLGREVNVYGLDIRRIEMQHTVIDGTRVLAVKGEIANVTGRDRKIPSLRFGLRDQTGAEVYQWTLDTGARPLRPGEMTSFVTRVASPPDAAQRLEIRFAHGDEIGLNAEP